LSTSEGALTEANGMTQRFNLNGTSDFHLILDANTGWVIENSISQNIDGSVTLEGGQLPAPMEVPMKIKSATKVTNNLFYFQGFRLGISILDLFCLI